MVNFVSDFEKNVRTIAPKAVNLRRAAGTSVLIPYSQVSGEILTKTG